MDILTENPTKLSKCFFTLSAKVKNIELEIWSLQTPSFRLISAHNCVLALVDHHQSTQHDQKSLFIESDIRSLTISGRISLKTKNFELTIFHSLRRRARKTGQSMPFEDAYSQIRKQYCTRCKNTEVRIFLDDPLLVQMQSRRKTYILLLSLFIFVSLFLDERQSKISLASSFPILQLFFYFSYRISLKEKKLF